MSEKTEWDWIGDLGLIDLVFECEQNPAALEQLKKELEKHPEVPDKIKKEILEFAKPLKGPKLTLHYD